MTKNKTIYQKLLPFAIIFLFFIGMLLGYFGKEVPICKTCEICKPPKDCGQVICGQERIPLTFEECSKVVNKGLDISDSLKNRFKEIE